MDRVILHSDMNSCYASIEVLHHPELRGLPVAVGGDPALRHGIVLAKTPEAKRCGVKTGEALWEARQKCPQIVFVPPHYDLYLRFSRMMRALYAEYTDRVEPFGLDECWLDVTGSPVCGGDGPAIAEQIRRRVREEAGITVSVGVSWNKIFAKFGSDYRKPDAVTVITRDNYRDIVWNAPAEDLLFVGRATSRKLRRYGIGTIGELARTDPAFLHEKLGKAGLMLHAFANGRDRTPVCCDGEEAPVKSIGNAATTPRDLTCPEDVRILVYILSESVAARLREEGLRCRTVELWVRDTELAGFTRQKALEAPTDISQEIAQAALALFAASYAWERPIRSLGVRACRLEGAQMPVQLDLFRDEKKREQRERMDRAVEEIRRRYGQGAVRRGILLRDAGLAAINAREDHTIHPVGYLQYGNRTGV